MKSYVENKLKYWYVPLILGIVFIGLGLWVFATPIATLLGIAIFFSIGFVFSGVFEIFYSISNRKEMRNWGWHLAGGAMTLLLGLLLFGRPDLTALVLSISIGFWLLFRSVMYTASSFELKEIGMRNWGWLLILGILGIIFSFILLFNPLLLGLTLVFWIGFGLIVTGIINIVIAFSVRKIKKETEFVDAEEIE